jgi:acyl carrier protein
MRPESDLTARSSPLQIDELIARIWTDVLQCGDPVTGEQNFFEAGGDSVAMMMLLFRVKEEFGVNLAPVDLMDAPTLQHFCRAVTVSRAALAGSDACLDPMSRSE